MPGDVGGEECKGEGWEQVMIYNSEVLIYARGYVHGWRFAGRKA